jgi:hypothetical protein
MAAVVVPKTEFVLLTAVERVILSLTAEQKRTMVDCLRNELDPPINISEKFELNGNTYMATIMSNAWVVIYREDPFRFFLPPTGRKIVLFDLLESQSALYSGYGIFV